MWCKAMCAYTPNNRGTLFREKGWLCRLKMMSRTNMWICVLSLFFPQPFGRFRAWIFEQFPIAQLFSHRLTQHVIGTVSNEATNDMGYQSWPLWRTCYLIVDDLVILLKHWSWGLDSFFSSCLLYHHETRNIFFHDFGTWCLSFCQSVCVCVCPLDCFICTFGPSFE